MSKNRGSVLSQKNEKTNRRSMKEEREYHQRYFRAISNPLRIQILRAINEGYVTIKDLELRTGLDVNTLNWHLSILENGLCVEKDIKDGKLVYTLTREGIVIDYLDE